MGPRILGRGAVGTRPDMQVAHVVGGQVGEDDADQHGEAGRPSVGLQLVQAVDVAGTRNMLVRREGERDLDV